MKIKNGFLLALFIVCPLRAQNSQNELDAQFLSVDQSVTLRPDGGMECEYYHKVKLLTYFAVNRYLGETFILYNPKFQKLTIEKSVTTMADGTEIPGPANAFNEILPGEVASAPAYAHLREMVVTHTGLERGCVVELRYRIETAPGFMPWLMDDYIFATSSPVSHSTLTLKVPVAATVLYRIFNGAGEPVMTTDNDFRVLKWTLDDVPMLRAESNHQAFAEFAPRLVYTTCQSWQQLVDFLTANLSQKLSLSPEGKQLLVADTSITDDACQLLALRKSVGEQVGTIQVDPALLGYNMAAAEKTLKRNYGHSLDKAILLCALAQACGFHSKVALISASEQFAEIPCLSQFQKACVQVQDTRNESMILIPESTQSRPGEVELAGRTLLFLNPTGHELMKLPKMNSSDNSVNIVMNLNVEEGSNAKGRFRIETSGYFHKGYQLQSRDDQLSFLQSIANQTLGSTTVTEFHVLGLTARQGCFEGELEWKSAFKAVAGSTLYKGTIASQIDVWHISAALQKRFTPVQLNCPFSEKVRITLHLPDGSTCAGGKDHYSLKNAMGRLVAARMVQPHEIQFEREMVVESDIVPVPLYRDFRDLMIQFEANDRRDIYFTKE